jgi:hypothetical protein
MDGDFQYISDTFLLERIFNILAKEDYNNEYGFVKQADISSFLESIKGTISNFVSSLTYGKDEGGIGRTITNLLVPATFFAIHPVLGWIVAIAQQGFGFDLYTIYNKIIDNIKPSIEQGKPVTGDVINNAAKSALPSVSDDESIISSEASLYPLKELEDIGYFNKQAQFGLKSVTTSVPFITENKNPFIRMFGFLTRRKGTSLLVGILVWFIKRILLSAGLLAIAGAATGILGMLPSLKPSENSSKPSENSSKSLQKITTVPTITTVSKPSSTNSGSQTIRINTGDIWIENIGNRQPHELVMRWAIDSYPELNQYQSIILSTPSFWNTIKTISQKWHPGQMRLTIPEQFKKKDDVINTFIDDVYKAINTNRGI